MSSVLRKTEEVEEVIVVGGIMIISLVVVGLLVYALPSIIGVAKGVQKLPKYQKGVLYSIFGLPVFQNPEVAKKVLKGTAESFIAPPFIFEGFKEGIDELRNPSVYKQEWIDLLGRDFYNTGFASLRYRAIQENGEHLAFIFKQSPKDYFDKLPLLAKSAFLRNDEISTFLIRQNLEITPFALDLHSIGGGNALALQEFIWTDYDKFPKVLANWNAQTDLDKIYYKKLYRNDVKLLEALQNKQADGMLIVYDRVLSIIHIAHQYSVTDLESDIIYNDYPNIQKNQEQEIIESIPNQVMSVSTEDRVNFVLGNLFS
jgi:hypothetical protein